MRVVLTAQAKADLQAIGRWIARDNVPRAISFVEELERKADSLATAHGHYPIVTAAGLPSSVRRLNHKGYRVLFRVVEADDLVEVLYIHHGRRAPPDVSA